MEPIDTCGGGDGMKRMADVMRSGLMSHWIYLTAGNGEGEGCIDFQQQHDWLIEIVANLVGFSDTHSQLIEKEAICTYSELIFFLSIRGLNH